ncbi:hypothetical protein JCM3770_002579 [Rhodotorula araucariae]
MTTTCSCSSVGNCTCPPGQCACASCHGGKDKAAACGCTSKDAQGGEKCSCSSSAECKCGDKCQCATCGKKGAAL